MPIDSLAVFKVMFSVAPLAENVARRALDSRPSTLCQRRISVLRRLGAACVWFIRTICRTIREYASPACEINWYAFIDLSSPGGPNVVVLFGYQNSERDFGLEWSLNRSRWFMNRHLLVVFCQAVLSIEIAVVSKGTR